MMTMRRLILMRHARASRPNATPDFERTLEASGEASATLVRHWLAANLPRPDFALISAARRTRETFDVLSGGMAGTFVEFEPRLYNADYRDILDLVREVPDSARTLFVLGHNPGIADMAFRLANRRESDQSALENLARYVPTASFALLTLPPTMPWAKLELGSAKLMRFLRPSDLGGVDED
jgi:phosphohistidine phosphatase